MKEMLASMLVSQPLPTLCPPCRCKCRNRALTMPSEMHLSQHLLLLSPFRPLQAPLKTWMMIWLRKKRRLSDRPTNIKISLSRKHTTVWWQKLEKRMSASLLVPQLSHSGNRKDKVRSSYANRTINPKSPSSRQRDKMREMVLTHGSVLPTIVIYLNRASAQMV